jgi:hypothetical protein
MVYLPGSANIAAIDSAAKESISSHPKEIKISIINMDTC